ncbi:unnamed protein product [Allacma fusca]|uniref:Uncharacterized protein n=1 Tax=Allacma fusca TaxID=39272 RepID=A0A8J2PSV6_9HEXA|nr:unnamed protein product [Allacma fusca]
MVREHVHRCSHNSQLTKQEPMMRRTRRRRRRRSPQKVQNPMWFEAMEGDTLVYPRQPEAGPQENVPGVEGLDTSAPAGLGPDMLKRMAELTSWLPQSLSTRTWIRTNKHCGNSVRTRTRPGSHPEVEPSDPEADIQELIQDLNEPGKDIGVLAYRMASPQLYFTLVATANYQDKSVFGDFLLLPKPMSANSPGKGTEKPDPFLPPPVLQLPRSMEETIVLILKVKKFPCHASNYHLKEYCKNLAKSPLGIELGIQAGDVKVPSVVPFNPQGLVETISNTAENLQAPPTTATIKRDFALLGNLKGQPSST